MVSWTTSEPASSEFNFEFGDQTGPVITDANTYTQHQVKISGVKPGIDYGFEIKARDQRGNIGSSGQRSFRLTPAPALQLPAGVTDLSARVDDGLVELSWRNPIIDDLAEVLVLRGTVGYPTGLQDGELVFSGLAEIFLEQGLQNGQRYFYSVLAKDNAGNLSTAVIISAVPQKIQPGAPLPKPESPEQFLPTTPEQEIPVELKQLMLDSFEFIQGDKFLYVVNNKIIISNEQPLLILIAYHKLPEVLKTISVTLRDAKDQIFTFLLRVDDLKENYLARINPPVSGAYDISISILDFKNRISKTLQGQLIVSAPVESAPHSLDNSLLGRILKLLGWLRERVLGFWHWLVVGLNQTLELCQQQVNFCAELISIFK